jgi:queuosine precursor transporter
MRVIFYLLSIVVANIVTARFAPLELWMFIIPWGSWLIGATFILRDLVQTRYGRKKTYLIIFGALALSAVSSFVLGDTLLIVIASALSFLVAETTDTEIFTRLKTTFAKRVLFSGLVGGLLDSAIFVVVGLSPLGAGFIPWVAVPYAILGQVLIKTAMQFVGVTVIKAIKN